MSGALDVAPLSLVTSVPDCHESLCDVEGNDELEIVGLVPDDPDRVDRDVRTRCPGHEPDDGQSVLIGSTERNVLGMRWILAPVLVTQEPIWSFSVLVRRDLTRRCEARPDRQGRRHVGRLANSTLWVHQRNPSPLEAERGQVPESNDPCARPDALV